MRLRAAIVVATSLLCVASPAFGQAMLEVGVLGVHEQRSMAEIDRPVSLIPFLPIVSNEAGWFVGGGVITETGGFRVDVRVRPAADYSTSYGHLVLRGTRSQTSIVAGGMFPTQYGEWFIGGGLVWERITKESGNAYFPGPVVYQPEPTVNIGAPGFSGGWAAPLRVAPHFKVVPLVRLLWWSNSYQLSVGVSGRVVF